MLGKLTRWLRMLGQDVVYVRSMDDKELIQKAKNEDRILLTRDNDLFQEAERKGYNAFLVIGETESEKLANLAERFKFKLEIDLNFSRCPNCNTKIESVSKVDIFNRIPKRTSSYYNDFWECRRCGQIYWRGAHWKRIEQTLTKARKRDLQGGEDLT
jgi:uncharacterized protein with PIN domain